MTIVKITDIEKKFTELVNERLVQGYHVYFYSGSQGEQFKICLTKDDKNIRMIYVIEKHEYVNNESIDTISIIEEEFNVSKRGTMWFGKGQLIQETKWFIYGRYHADVYVQHEDELKELESIQHERCDNRFAVKASKEYAKLERSPKNVKIALKLVQKQKGFKSATAKSIMEIKRNVNMKRYEITVNRGRGNDYVFIKM